MGSSGASGGGGGTTIVRASGYVTAGDTTTTNVGATWTIISALDDFAIAAVVGDRLTFTASFLARMLGTNFIDAVVIANGSIVRYASSGTGTPAVEGDPTAYRDAGDQEVRGVGPFSFVAESTDLHGGNCTFGIAFKGTGTTSVVYSSSNYPFRWEALNFGPA